MGCHEASSRALIPPEDQDFLEAQSRLERTAAFVEASGAPTNERAAFMQAEGFFRYRYAMNRSGKALSAEALASATDLPMFQSAAGSLDLQAMRVEGADAATQLWEGFLRRYPNSELKALTKYRLGWSYRSVGIEGLPGSTENAFADLVNCETPEPIRSAAIAARTYPWKSKGTASTLSLIPGAGQLYLGETASGIVRLAVAAVSAAAVIVPAVIGAERGSDLTWRHDWPLLLSSGLGVIVLSLDYTLSYEDALRGVIRFNERQELRFEQSHPDVP